MVTMEGNSTLNNFTTLTISFKTEMIYEEVDIERTGKPDQGWYHLFTRTDRINQIDALIQPGIRGEDIIDEERDTREFPWDLNIGAEHFHTGIPEYHRGSKIGPNPHFSR